MSWNVWWRFGDWRRREPLIRRVLRETAPDLLGLQEVWGTPAECQAQRLAAELGMHYAWLPSPAPEQFQRRIEDSTVDVGNAILSRWPIVSRAACNLAGSASDPGRTALLARIDTTVGAISFTTTQFSSALGGSATRCEQVRVLSAFIAKETCDRRTAILTGDLNAEPDSDELRLLGGHKTAPPIPGQIFVDAWLYADPTEHAWTWDRRNPAVDAGGEPSARCDYVLVGYRVGTRRTHRVRKAWLTGNTPVDGVWPSDHAAVVAELIRHP